MTRSQPGAEDEATDHGEQPQLFARPCENAPNGAPSGARGGESPGRVCLAENRPAPVDVRVSAGHGTGGAAVRMECL
jgi:hypothetical protein